MVMYATPGGGVRAKQDKRGRSRSWMTPKAMRCHKSYSLPTAKEAPMGTPSEALVHLEVCHER